MLLPLAVDLVQNLHTKDLIRYAEDFGFLASMEPFFFGDLELWETQARGWWILSLPG
jgi:hypothetical protein